MSILPVKTKFFFSSDVGAPVLSGGVGSLISVLDAILVDGFNLKSVTSLSVNNDVATLVSAGHGFSVNRVIKIDGAVPSQLNGEWRVSTSSSDSLTFITSGISNQTATGTITARRAAAGWEKQFTGTNRAVYRSADILSSRQGLRITDTFGQYAEATLAESFSGIDTIVNGVVTHYFKKSGTSDGTSRPWVAVADGKTAYLCVQWDSLSYYETYRFGDYESFVAADPGRYLLGGSIQSGPTSIGQYTDTGIAGGEHLYPAVCSRNLLSNYSVAVPLYPFSACGAVPASSVSPYFAASGNRGVVSSDNSIAHANPSLSDNGLHFFEEYLSEFYNSAYHLRGKSRGLLHMFEFNTVFNIHQNVAGIDVGVLTVPGKIRVNGNNQRLVTQCFSLADWS